MRKEALFFSCTFLYNFNYIIYYHFDKFTLIVTKGSKNEK